ncbi:UPF0481 protein At3g47200-like [Eucalyptus grandis]|uniref:UPF0481 protein At3g47200-like n=1 Tax=Eucalyptus grandis TaxID=71139 RepID=UPI00192EF8E8|nr:UPF0481 protein At3g47200-like [Eucalyptus grandis]
MPQRAGLCTVSFGPYHHGKPALQMLEEHKWRYLPAMLDRIHPHGIGLEDLIGVVGPKEEMIRHCYSESTDMFSGPDFVKMMVLDGCFIIELLLRWVRSELSEPDYRLRKDPFYAPVHELLGSEQDDPLLRNSYLFTSLVRDLLRLENQVPYFVLEDLFAITNVSKVKFTLVDLAFRVFSCYLKEPYSGWKRQGDNHSVSDVAQLFRDVCKDASCDSQADYLEEIGIKKWYTPYRMWKALVKEVYFSNPEVSISVVTLLVTLTGVIQTVYALLQYYQPK